MGTSPGPPKQPSYAPYTPQPQYHVQPPKQSKSPQPQNQQHQYGYSPYQAPQQTQYYFPPQQQHQHAASTSPVPTTATSHQQHFLAELEAPQITHTSRPTSSSSSAAPAAAAGKDGVPVFEMAAESAPAKPTTPRPVSSSGSVSPAANDTAAQKPLIQANPWGFFLEDDPPARTDSISPSKEGNADEMLSVKPLKIVKTGPGSPKPDQEADSKLGNGPQSGIADPASTQPVLPEQSPEVGLPVQQGGEASPDDAPLAPAPLNISRPPAPTTAPPPVPTGSPPLIIPPAGTYPIPPAGTYPPPSPTRPGSGRQPSPAPQINLPMHPRPTSASSARPVSAGTSAVVTPLSPAHTGATTAPSPQQPQYATAHSLQPSYSQAPSQAYTSATPVSPVFAHAALPPTLPMSSYFPQQPSYARPDANQTPPAHHSPAASLSSIAAEQPTYASPPPSYTQAISQGRPANVSPASSTPATTAPLSPMTTASTISSYPFSPADIGAPSPNPSNVTPLQQHPYNPHAPPIPQPSYVNGPQGCTPTPPPLPPRTSPAQSYGGHPQNPYGPPPTRLNYTSPPAPAKSSSGLFGHAKKLLDRTTDFVDQAITPYLQDNRYRPPHSQYGQHSYQYQYQYPPNRPLQPGQYYQQAPQGYAPAQRR
ncbi:hypothetical protein CkaCkLH20_03177 [Colletotrichum karsti]|uniref:Uncharacterized protein n=1 Tax=Colletotrichum karsti TaxID=1095194 RepID=A0A9P6IB82_9PEZI|nr:uncharacterized protein CkaCkLH20_03177 [Colletotrichum karsti]KAF9879634.1 hypothetical protein CkaCkLH20_03177 [Colletotrichum karsti]